MKTKFPKLYATLTLAFDGDETAANDVLTGIVADMEKAGIEIRDRVRLEHAFDWKESSQGHEYWDALTEGLIEQYGADYLEPDFKEAADEGDPVAQLIIKFGATRSAVTVILGMLRAGIPPFLLPEEVLAAEIEEYDAQESAARAAARAAMH